MFEILMHAVGLAIFAGGAACVVVVVATGIEMFGG